MTNAPHHPDQVEPTPTAAKPRKTWSAGSLTYSAGGLALLTILLLSGDFAWSMRERSVQPLFQILLRKYDASDFLTSLLVGSVPALLTVIVWPVVSVWSDRTRTRWGRRIPFLFFPTPFICVAMAGLAFAPEIGTRLHQFAGHAGSAHPFILATFGFFWVVFEVFALVTNSVFYGLVNDTVPRAMIGRFFALFRMAGLGAAIYFNFSLIGYAETHAREVFLAIAAVYVIGFSTMCLFVKEGTYPAPPPRDARENFRGKVVRYFRECGQDRTIRWAFLALSLANLAALPVNLFSIYNAQSYGLDAAHYGKLLATSFIISFAISFPIGWLADRFHPMGIVTLCLAVHAGTVIAGFFLIEDAHAFGIFFIVHTVLSGCVNTASLAVYPLVFPQAQFSQFYSAFSLLNNFLIFAVSPVLGGILKVTHSWYQLTFLLSGLIGISACFFTTRWLWQLTRPNIPPTTAESDND